MQKSPNASMLMPPDGKSCRSYFVSFPPFFFSYSTLFQRVLELKCLIGMQPVQNNREDMAHSQKGHVIETEPPHPGGALIYFNVPGRKTACWENC